MNFGDSKGLSFDRVVIYPTLEMKRWLQDHNHPLKEETRAKLYVAITRARHSVAFVLEMKEVGPQKNLIQYQVQTNETSNNLFQRSAKKTAPAEE